MSLETLAATDTDKLDPLVPKDSEGNPILYRGNPVHMEGCLLEVSKSWERDGLFEAALKDNAVLVKDGKLAIDSADAVQFINGTAADEPRGFDNPCVDTVERVAQFNARAAADRAAAVAGGADPADALAAHPDFVSSAGLSPSDGNGYVISKYAIKAENKRRV